MKSLKSLFIILLSLAFTTSVAQTYSGYIYDAGNPAYSVNIPVENGYINVANGNLHLEFPLSTLPQRGGLKLNERLVYDSHWWKIGHYSNYYWWPDNLPRDSHLAAGWRFVNGAGVGTLSSNLANFSSYQCDDMGNYSQNATYTFTWQDPSGVNHTFDNGFYYYYSGCDSSGGYDESYSSPSNDSTGLVLTATGNSASGPSSIVIRDTSGNQVYPKLADRYGNYWDTDSNGDLVDSRGLTPVVTTYDDANHKIYFDVLRDGGGRARYTVTTVNVQPRTSFQEQAVNEYPNGNNAQNLNAVESIQLPDGTKFSFRYDGAYAMIDWMQLPTGSVITYGWDNFQDSYRNKNRWLTLHRVDGNPEMSFTPSVLSLCGASQVNCHEQVIYHEPGGDETLYDQQLNNGAWNTTAYRYAGVMPGSPYAGSSATGHIVTSTQTAYDFSNACQSACNNVGAKWITASNTTTIYQETGATLRKENLYYDNTLGLIQKERFFDFYFGNNVPSQPLSQKEYFYNPAAGLSTDLRAVWTEDGIGNPASATQYTYNSTPDQTTSGLPHHDTSLSANAYLKSVGQWVNTENGTYHTTTYTTDDAGFVHSAQESMGGVTYPAQTFTPDATDTFTAASSTTVNGIVLGKSAQPDPTTGLLHASVDYNGNQTTMPSYDDFGRLLEVDYPDTGVTRHWFPDPNHAWTSRKTSNTTPDAQTAVETDGLGRTSRTAVLNGQGNWYQNDICYDANGRVAYESYPYQGSGWSTPIQCSGIHTTYDTLGRPLTVSDGDGTTQYQYLGRATRVTDIHGKQKITQVDGLGRITAVCEVTNSGSMPNSGSPADCGLDIAGTGFLTTYSYDLVNHTTAVNQGGQLRRFITDSIGRPTVNAEPESGGTQFQYTYNATGMVETRINTLSQTRTTQFDSIGRPLTISYSDGTPQKTFVYDVPDSRVSVPFTNIKGRTTIATTGNNDTYEWFSYDAMGRTTETMQCLPRRCYDRSFDVPRFYTYDLVGNKTSERYLSNASGGTPIDTFFDHTVAGEVSAIRSSQGGNLISNVAQTVNGPDSYHFGNGLNGKIDYDSVGRSGGTFVCTGPGAQYCAAGGTQIYGYQRGISGSQVYAIDDTVLNTHGDFSYDDFNRLQTASFPNLGRAIQWTYDRWGNRTSQAATQGSVTPSSPTIDTSTNRIANGLTNNLGQLTSDGLTHTFTYDGEGNVVKLDGNSVTYVYDALNRRVEVDYPNYSRQFSFDADGNKMAEWDGNSSSPSLLTASTYWDGRPVAYWDASTASANKTQITLRFTNDACDCIGTAASGDRNLFVDSLTVAGTVVDLSSATYPACTNLPGRYINNNGSLLCSGDMIVTVPTVGPIALTVHGQQADGVNPHAQLFVNGIPAGEGDVPTSALTFHVNPQISIRFTNDAADATGDRNLYVQSVSMGNQTLASSDGAWSYDACNFGNGGLACGGSMTAAFNQFGPITVTAYGSTSQGIGPHMQVLVDGQVVGEWDVPTSPTTFSTLNTGYHFQHADLLGTERVRTNSYGQPEQYFTSIPFGDEFSPGGLQNVAPQFALLDRDGESDTEHALYRQYSSKYGRWMSPDPYSGSYDFSNPQSFNRYAYGNNMPLSGVDPKGLDPLTLSVIAYCGGASGACAAGASNVVGAIALGALVAATSVLDLLTGAWFAPKFHGSVKPRPRTPQSGCHFDGTSIDNYLTSKGSPMSGTGATFMNVGKEFNLDPRLLVSVAGAESQFGTKITMGENNALNVLYGKPRSNSPFVSFNTNIHSAGRSIANPANQYDLTNTTTFYSKYCSGTDCKNGLNNLNEFMKEQGADKTALQDPCQ